jgi:hypothetical protein
MLHTCTWAHGQTYSDREARRARRARRTTESCAASEKTAPFEPAANSTRAEGYHTQEVQRTGARHVCTQGRQLCHSCGPEEPRSDSLSGSCARRLAQQSQCRRLASVNRDRLLPRLATCDRYQSSSGRLAVLLYNTTRSSRGCLPQSPWLRKPLPCCASSQPRSVVQKSRGNRGNSRAGNTQSDNKDKGPRSRGARTGATVQRLVDAGCRWGLRTLGS